MFCLRASRSNKTARERVGRHYVSVYLSLDEDHVWNLGLAISKSKRASNDWYQGKSSRRALRLERAALAPTPTGAVFAAVRLVLKLIATLPSGDWVLVNPADNRRCVLPRYMERHGFKPISMNGKPVWALRVR